MIAKTRDPDLINRIANSDGVREFIHVRGEMMDFSPACAERQAVNGIVFLTNGTDAVAVFEITADQEFKADTIFAGSCRGRAAVETGREMVEFMFRHGAKRLWGITPLTNAKARWFNRQIGATVIMRDDEDEVFEIRKAA